MLSSWFGLEPMPICSIDLAKRSFQVHGAKADGSVAYRRQLSRGKLLSFLASQPPCTVATEACASARYLRASSESADGSVDERPRPASEQPPESVSMRAQVWIEEQAQTPDRPCPGGGGPEVDCGRRRAGHGHAGRRSARRGAGGGGAGDTGSRYRAAAGHGRFDRPGTG